MDLPILRNAGGKDTLADKLRSIAQVILTAIFGLLPLIFIPLPAAPLEYTKVILVIGDIALALIFFALSVLRSGSVGIYTPISFWLFWGVAAAVTVSAFLSGDINDSFIGNAFEVHTAAFVLLLATTMTTWLLVGVKKEHIMRLFMLFVGSTIVLAIFHALRLVVGVEPLSLGVFGSTVSTPIGGWNDLALFFGLTILLALVTFEQLPITKWGRIIFGGVVAVALAMLAIINFFFVWIVLGVVSLVMLVYTLGKDRFTEGGTEQKTERSFISLVLPVVVLITSLLFILGGSFFGSAISRATNITYLEVRPSFTATADIVRGVYGEDIPRAFLGMGPNRFADAWRTHKDRALNETIFWNTDFQAGSGYIPTFFVTSGILGGLLWLTFLGFFVVTGVRTLLKPNTNDRVWYFIATVSFVSALYVWGMSLVYIPGVTMLLIGALCTGVAFIAQSNLAPERVKLVRLAFNRRSGFILTLGVIAVIMASVGSFYATARHYGGVYTFAKSAASVAPGIAIEDVETVISNAYETTQNDLFARRIAELQIAKMNTLLTLTEPTQAQQQQFQAAIVAGINAAKEAVAKDGTEPENWAVLGRIYSILVTAKIDQSYEFGKEALTKARELDPQNPLRVLELAVLESRKGNMDDAMQLAAESIGLKSNYSDALFYISQLQIAKGDVASAIDSTRSMIQLEPQNPLRYFQLGVLEASQKNVRGAIAAFEAAVNLDQNYANARYFLALAYSEEGRGGDARAQLQKVLELNPGNELVAGLIAELDATGKITPAETVNTTTTEPVTSDPAVTETNGSVTTTEVPETDLVKPVNTPTQRDANTEEAGE